MTPVVRSSLCRIALALAVLLPVADFASTARAQEVANEQSDVRHIYDDVPVWEAEANASVELRAPEGLTICRQGRVVLHDGIREAHMGCWAQREPHLLRLDVPSGVAYLAVRHGIDLTWIGGPITLAPGDILEVQIDDRLAVRVVGWVVIALSVAAIVVGSVGAATRRFGSDLGNIVTLAVGATTVFLGLAMALLNDGVGISVVQPPSVPEN